jgi:hypothetical protein
MSLLAMSDGYQRIFTRLAGMSGLYRLAVSGPPTIGVSPAPRWLSALPSGAAFVELSEQTVSIFWNEKEGPDGLNTLSQVIDSIG